MKAIILIGYMCSGKTTLGKELATQLGTTFIDTDQLIESSTQTTIQNLFQTRGEHEFRLLEHELLKSLPKENCVIATGGGLPCFNNNMDTLKKVGRTIYLKHAPDVLLDRLNRDHSNRPLHNSAITLEQLKEHLLQREVYYNLADLICTTNDQHSDFILNQLNHDELS